MRGQKGFTLVEVTVGAAIAFFVIWLLVAMANRYVQTAARLNSKLSSQTSAARLVERWASESASAWAVFVPRADVLGRDNGDGHELDFFTEDGSHRTFAWAYLYDASTKTISRYAYAPGIVAQPGETWGNVDSFVATSANADGVSDASSAAYDPLFARVAVSNVNYAFADMPGATGGNRITHVSLDANGMPFAAELSSATAPTTFTIVLKYTPPPAIATPTPTPLPTFP